MYSSNKKPLRYDYFLKEKNILIEVDEKQHFIPASFGGVTKEVALEKFEVMKKHDTLKEKFALDNNIKLIRINYKQCETDEYIEILSNELLG